MTGYAVRLYDSLDAFYREADPRLREFSGEVDFGVHWSDPLLPAQVAGWPRWRVAWIRETGEVYAVCQHPLAERRSVRLYGAVKGQAEAEAFLAGWADHCRAGGLAWLEGLFEAREGGG